MFIIVSGESKQKEGLKVNGWEQFLVILYMSCICH